MTLWYLVASLKLEKAPKASDLDAFYEANYTAIDAFDPLNPSDLATLQDKLRVHVD
ncbi:Hypothetical protein POVN_LOCUS156 [uncultured virus]|nr:Hypothetical protein POVN_LOCUS156 [uncultured virus]